MSLEYLGELLEYWASGFNWRAVEGWLNQFPQFRATIRDIGLHYVFVRGIGSNKLPIIITHGWPSSFWEMTKLIPLLAQPELHGGQSDDAFDVVVPSLPGFTFSDPFPHDGGFAQVPDIWHELMSSVLGYSRYAVHGGDLGSDVSVQLAAQRPESVVGLHLTSVPIFVEVEGVLHPDEEEFLAAHAAWWETEGAYSHLHRTRPQTLGVALSDSPAALAAWIVDKFRSWSDCNGSVESRFSKDDLLTNISLYWYTNTGPSSLRPYFDRALEPTRFERVSVPTAVAMFPKEIARAPRIWAERTLDVHRFVEMPRGGHFAAFEEPELLAHDLREFFRPFRD